MESLNPLKRVNSILTKLNRCNLDWSQMVSIPSNGSIQFLPKSETQEVYSWDPRSQSPQTGQFNSYLEVKDVL